MRYEAIEPVSRETAERVAGNASADELSKVILAVALHEADGA